jgi:hypothetical protein
MWHQVMLRLYVLLSEDFRRTRAPLMGDDLRVSLRCIYAAPSHLGCICDRSSGSSMPMPCMRHRVISRCMRHQVISCCIGMRHPVLWRCMRHRVISCCAPVRRPPGCGPPARGKAPTGCGPATACWGGVRRRGDGILHSSCMQHQVILYASPSPLAFTISRLYAAPSYFCMNPQPLHAALTTARCRRG